ncbi:flagellar biosynthetic protein FliR [Marinobacterium arenosum]|uniref:flagellar biosynthetic protein FliR n=1 Tax=Marinobacterium arenosum TaxID=2862496 RepID=UPI001C986E8F|nr:flagellar biosynthetic protein FliR [Marinobacterium arenosum]MBY4675957.1 flagellar type III secretion system protein FliR [Marinobacterium arenosum]
MFEISILEIEQWVAAFLWPLFRIASFFMVMPVIGSQLVPVRIRLGLALAVTVLVVPLLPPMPEFDGLSLQTLLVILQQVLIGTVLGFIAQILFQVFVLGAQLIATQMGLGFASMTDPANGVSVVILGQIYLTLVMLLFIVMNGHLVLIDVLVRSFNLIPVGLEGLKPDVFWQIALSGLWLFSAALLMSLPAVTALLVVNFAFGIMTRAAPQLNIFAIGFPFTMTMGLFVVYASLSGFLGQYQRISEFALDFVTSVLFGGR